MKDGYYWVRFKFEKEWRIALSYTDICGETNLTFSGNDSSTLAEQCEIGDYIETPDKYKDK